MGNGLPPTPANDLGDPIRIDSGTLARTESPQPGPVGLDAKGGTKQAQPSMADRIVSYATQRMGQHVGDGQCYALVDGGLRNAGAKSAPDFGTITPTADYVWGTSISQSAVRRGDVIQFRDYRFVRHVETETDEGTRTLDDEGGRPHHTAIVERVDGNGAITVLEQNFQGSPVRRSQLFFTSGTFTSGNTTTTVTVSGTFWFYRAQPQ